MPARTEAGLTTECERCRTDSNIQALRRVTEYSVPGWRDYPRTRGKEFADSCRILMDANGNVGRIGRELAVLMATKYPREFLNDNHLKAVCPKFPSLSKEDKLKAWVWFWTVLANEESSCEPDTPHGYQGWGTTKGWGLYAAEYYPSDRAPRGEMCAGDIKREKVQVNCAVATMVDLQFKKGRGVLASNSYWGPVRRYDEQILPNMRVFRKCFAR